MRDERERDREWDKDQDDDQEEQPRRRRNGLEEDEKKKRPPIYCGSCLKEIKQGDAVFEVDGAYVNQTRRRVNICFACAYNPPKVEIKMVNTTDGKIALEYVKG